MIDPALDESETHALASAGVVIEKGLRKGSLGYVSNVVIAVGSTAPAYSLAATLGVLAAIRGVGLQTPALLILSFVPMFLVAQAYRQLNRADPDCGTTFAWVTRALGPGLGWMGGWAIIVSDLIVMANLAQIAGTYSFLLVRWHSAATSVGAVTAVGVVWMVAMTWICCRGIELSARTQALLLATEVLVLAVFASVAFIKVYVERPVGSVRLAMSWFDPGALHSVNALLTGVLVGLFVFWGWDTGVAVNEESRDSADAPGKAAVVSTVLLLLIYVGVAVAAQAYAGPGRLAANQSDVLTFLGGKIFPRPLDLLLVLAVLTSASASTLTTILPTARTALSMARWGATSGVFGRVDPRFKTPVTSTVAMCAVSIVWFVVIVNVSTNVLADSITALGFLIAFYYGLTGIACAVYYRRELRRSVRNLVLLGLAPLFGGLILFAIFIEALVYYGNPGNTASAPVFGIGAPVVIGGGSLVLGGAVLLLSRSSFPVFFARRREVADPTLVAAGEHSAGGRGRSDVLDGSVEP